MERTRFVEALTKLKETAAEQGQMITSEQLEEQFEALALTQEQRTLVFQYLKDAKIGVDEPVCPEDYMVGEDKAYLQIYLEELKQLPPCSQGKKEALLISAMAGEKGVIPELTMAFLPLVVDIAKLYVGQGVLLEDLIGEGNVALAVVMEMLPSQESPKEAEEMIAQMVMKAMEELVREYSSDHMNVGEIADKANFVLEKANALSSELCRKVTLEEVSQETGMSIEELDELLRVIDYKIEVIDINK